MGAHSVLLPQVTNVTPRYARLKSSSGKNEVIGWENIELISDRPLEVMLGDFKRLKEEFPDRYRTVPASLVSGATAMPAAEGALHSHSADRTDTWDGPRGPALLKLWPCKLAW